MSTKSLKILFYPCDAVGHVNAATGIAEVLIQSGHKVIFAVSEQWKGRLTKYGIEELLLPQEGKVETEDPAVHWVNIMKNANAFTGLSPLERLINFRKNLMPVEVKNFKETDVMIESLLKRIKPDLILLDQFLCIASVVKSGIPWVWWCSPNPLVFLEDERTPPGCSGLPAIGPKTEWKKFREAVNEATHEVWEDWNDYVVSKGLPPLEPNRLYCTGSPFLNIYGFPLELDYTDLRPLPPKWHRFDNLKRTERHTNFEIPDQLRGKPGKLIYFSLGSMGSSDLELMKRLVAILAKSKHRFIISKGPLHKEYSLADNMWGQQSVPQIQVLPLVDLVITHGGNNTVTETFYFGKPMVVMPLFGDQHDNAQRVQEKGFGLKFNPFECTQDQLINGIEQLLNDKLLNERLKSVANRIQTENSIAILPKLIEDLVSNQ